MKPLNGMEDDWRSSAGCQLGGCRSPVTSLSFQCCQHCPQHLALAQAQPCSVLKQLPCASCVHSLRRCMSCHLCRQGRLKASVSRLGSYAQRQVCEVAAAEPRIAGPTTRQSHHAARWCLRSQADMAQGLDMHYGRSSHASRSVEQQQDSPG